MGKNEFPTRRVDPADFESAHRTASQRKAEKRLRLFDPALVSPALLASVVKLNPATQLANPVMFVVYIGSIVTTLLWIQSLGGHGEAPSWFILNTAIWLWFTVLFANFAEALAEGRSKAQAAQARGLKKDTVAKRF